MFSFSLILIYYSILLLVTKMAYKSINSFLIKLSIINKKFEHKDFTYLNWDSSNPTTPMWWDEQLAKSPSLLDLTFTFVLIAVPFLLCAWTSYFLTSIFAVHSFF